MGNIQEPSKAPTPGSGNSSELAAAATTGWSNPGPAARQTALACLLHPAAEEDPVRLLALRPPGVHHHCLARQDGTREPRLDRTQPVRLPVTPQSDDKAAGDSEGAEAVKNGPAEPAQGRKSRVDMQGVEVAGQAVERSLVGCGLETGGLVGTAVGWQSRHRHGER